MKIMLNYEETGGKINEGKYEAVDSMDGCTQSPSILARKDIRKTIPDSSSRKFTVSTTTKSCQSICAKATRMRPRK